MQWQVQAYRGKNRNIHLGKTWVRADSESQATELGKRALRLIGIRGVFRVSVSEYRPECDREFFGYMGFNGTPQELERFKESAQ